MSIRAQRAAAAEIRLNLPAEERDFDLEAITEERKEMDAALEVHDVLAELRRNMSFANDVRT